MEQYRIGIVDDDPSKVTQMITYIRLCCNDGDGRPRKEKYANYKLIPVELKILDQTTKMVEYILEERLDAVIIDYKLSSQQSISYSGVSLARELQTQIFEYPVFILTTYQDDLFDHELFDSYLVFDFARYISDDSERIELNSKLIEQIKKHRTDVHNWENELIDLIAKAGKSSEIDERILELDNMLEKSINGRKSFSIPVKRDFTAAKLNDLILKIDSLIEGE